MSLSFAGGALRHGYAQLAARAARAGRRHRSQFNAPTKQHFQVYFRIFMTNFKNKTHSLGFVQQPHYKDAYWKRLNNSIFALQSPVSLLVSRECGRHFRKRRYRQVRVAFSRPFPRRRTDQSPTPGPGPHRARHRPVVPPGPARPRLCGQVKVHAARSLGSGHAQHHVLYDRAWRDVAAVGWGVVTFEGLTLRSGLPAVIKPCLGSGGP